LVGQKVIKGDGFRGFFFFLSFFFFFLVGDNKGDGVQKKREEDEMSNVGLEGAWGPHRIFVG
jgi:hypothetical protein